MCHIFPVQSIIDGHLGWFQVFPIVNSAAMNMRVHATHIKLGFWSSEFLNSRDQQGCDPPGGSTGESISLLFPAS